MVKILGLSLAGMLTVALASAQEASTPPPGGKPLPDAAPLTPKIRQPDTTLLNDTRAAGLKPRLKQAASTALPVGKKCIIQTLQGQQYTGVLESHGEWFVLRREGQNVRMWIAADQVLVVTGFPEGEGKPPAPEEGAFGETPGDADSAAVAQLKATVKKLQAELDDTRAKFEAELAAAKERLSQARDEAAAALRETEVQRDLSERVRQRAEAARKAAEQELQILWEHLKQATEKEPD